MDCHRWPRWRGGPIPKASSEGRGQLPTPYYAYRLSQPPPFPLFPPLPIPGNSPDACSWTPRRQPSELGRRRSWVPQEQQQQAAQCNRRSERQLRRASPLNQQFDADDESSDSEIIMRPAARSSLQSAADKGSPATSSGKVNSDARGRSGLASSTTEYFNVSEPVKTGVSVSDVADVKVTGTVPGKRSLSSSADRKAKMTKTTELPVSKPKTPPKKLPPSASKRKTPIRMDDSTKTKTTTPGRGSKIKTALDPVVVLETDARVEDSDKSVSLTMRDGELLTKPTVGKGGKKATATATTTNSFLGSVLKTDLGEILRRSCRERKSNSRFSDDGLMAATAATATATTPPLKSANGTDKSERALSVRLRLKRDQASQLSPPSPKRAGLKKELGDWMHSPASNHVSSTPISDEVGTRIPRRARKSIGNSPSKMRMAQETTTEEDRLIATKKNDKARKSLPRSVDLSGGESSEVMEPVSESRKCVPARKSMHVSHVVTTDSSSGESVTTTTATTKDSSSIGLSFSKSTDSTGRGTDSPLDGSHKRPKRRHFKGATYSLSLKPNPKKKKGPHGSSKGSRDRTAGESSGTHDDMESVSTEASYLAETDGDDPVTVDTDENTKPEETVGDTLLSSAEAIDDEEFVTVMVGTKKTFVRASHARLLQLGGLSDQEVPSYSPGIPEAAKGQEAPRTLANQMGSSVSGQQGSVAAAETANDVASDQLDPNIGVSHGDQHQQINTGNDLELQTGDSAKENGVFRSTKRKQRDEENVSAISSNGIAVLTRNSRDKFKSLDSNHLVSPNKSPPASTEGRRIISITVQHEDQNCALPPCTCRNTYGIHLSRESIGSPCQGVDCIDKRLIGCVNTVTTAEVYRPSVRISFLALCEVHRQRLRFHQCCPGCGLFCTQGSFVQCRADPKKAVVHHTHPDCLSTRDGVPACPHCFSTTALLEVSLELNAPRSPALLTFPRKRKEPGARMAFTRGNENVISPDPSKLAPSKFCTISESGKEISSAGLPVGPDRTHLECLLENILPEKPGIQCYTAKNMQLAVKAGDMEKVLQMLTSGFDPNTRFEDQENCSIVHLAAIQGNLVLVHLLVQAGACLDSMDNLLQTPIMLSIENNFSLVSLYLIKAGVQLDARGEDGMTALHLAAKAGQLDVCRTILDTGKVNANILDDGGWTPLVWAAEFRHVDVVKFLLERGSDPNLRDNERNIALHWSAFSGSLEICEIFLNQGCNLNSTNEHGDTPLHIAARQDKYECVMLFLARNADVDVVNEENETPLMCCPDVQSQTWLALSMTKHLKKISESRTTRSERIMHQDISRGKEQNPIQCVNCFDDEPSPSDFLYIRDNCETSPINMDRSIASLQCCQCEDDCSSPNCTCGSLSLKCWYDKEGKLIDEFNLLDPPMIFECNRACRCYTTCNNRTVQHGITCRLQLFRTKVKGWGVRALREIPKGTFICEYVGELISDMEADQRQDDSYLFDLDNRDGETYCIDARRYGNISRFINHLCEPNLVPVKIFIDYQDLRFPRIALFSSRTIRANEELGFDYGDKFWIIKCKDFTCACMAAKCKYSEETINDTLANYHAMIRPIEVEQPVAPSQAVIDSELIEVEVDVIPP